MAHPYDHIEKQAISTAYNADLTAQLSIAISLKRIADALVHQPTGDYNLFDYIGQIARK